MLFFNWNEGKPIEKTCFLKNEMYLIQFFTTFSLKKSLERSNKEIKKITAGSKSATKAPQFHTLLVVI